MALVSPEMASGPRIAARPARRGARWAGLRDGRYATAALFLVPALTLFTLFVMLPMAEAGYYSLFKWNGFGDLSHYVGLRNYWLLARNRVFLSAIGNTGLVVAVSLLVQLPLALAMALLLAGRLPGRVLFRTVFFLPYILAEVASGMIWRFAFDGNYGLVAGIWRWFGAEPPFVLADQTWAIYAIMVVVVWKYFGFHMMIYIAGLQDIPKETIEAARIDGATPRQVLWYVVLPALLPTIRVSVFFAVVGSLQLFDLVIPLTGGGPSNSSHTVVSFLYSFGITRMDIGFGSAVGVVLFLVSVLFTVAYKTTLMRPERGAAR